MTLTLLFLLLACLAGYDCNPRWATYTKAPAFTDQMCPVEQVLFERVTVSAIDCVRTCDTTPGCESLVYLHDNRTCFGIKSGTPFTASSPLPGAVFLKPSSSSSSSTVSTSTVQSTTGTTTPAATTPAAATTTAATTTPTTTTTTTPTTTTPTTTPTTTTPTTTTTTPTTTPATTTTTTPTTTSTAPACVPPPFVCPATNETRFTQYCDQTFSFRLYFDTPRNFSAAKAECESQGGHLFEILTVEKMNFARQLVQCPDYNSSYVWIDGEYNGATAAYETSNGVPLPLTQGTFFYTGRPNSPGVGQCIWIEPNMDHLLDDAWGWAEGYMICEKPAPTTTSTTTATTTAPTTTVPPTNMTGPGSAVVGGMLDSQFTASSFYPGYMPWYAKLHNVASCWIPSDYNREQWIQVDFLDNILATHVITKGGPLSDCWVVQYRVLTSTNCTTYVAVKDGLGNDRIFEGNVDRDTAVQNTLEPPVVCRCLRINPWTVYENVTLRFDVLLHAITEGVPLMTAMPDSQLTASGSYGQGYEAWQARLNNTASCWRPATQNAFQWLQVDFVDQMLATHIVTMGNPGNNYWVASYKLSTSTNCVDYDVVKDGQGIDKIFDGNTDGVTAVQNVLDPPVTGRCFIINPRSAVTFIDLRFDVFGHEI